MRWGACSWLQVFPTLCPSSIHMEHSQRARLTSRHQLEFLRRFCAALVLVRVPSKGSMGTCSGRQPGQPWAPYQLANPAQTRPRNCIFHPLPVCAGEGSAVGLVRSCPISGSALQPRTKTAFSHCSNYAYHFKARRLKLFLTSSSLAEASCSSSAA